MFSEFTLMAGKLEFVENHISWLHPLACNFLVKVIVKSKKSMYLETVTKKMTQAQKCVTNKNSPFWFYFFETLSTWLSHEQTMLLGSQTKLTKIVDFLSVTYFRAWVIFSWQTLRHFKCLQKLQTSYLTIPCVSSSLNSSLMLNFIFNTKVVK